MTIKEQEDKIRTMLQQHVHHIIDRGHTSFHTMMDIVLAQEQWLHKLHTIQAFRVTFSSWNKSLLLQVKVDRCARWLRISWRKGSVTKRKDPDPLQSAFRQAVGRQIMIWKRAHHGQAVCVQCNQQPSRSFKLHADHKDPSFLALTQTFLTLHTLAPIGFDHARRGGRKFKKEDNTFKNKWQTFHRRHATLQWLCRRCNLHKQTKTTKDHLDQVCPEY